MCIAVSVSQLCIHIIDTMFCSTADFSQQLKSQRLFKLTVSVRVTQCGELAVAAVLLFFSSSAVRAFTRWLTL